MGDDRGSVLTLVGDSMDNSSTFLEPELHIVNLQNHPDVLKRVDLFALAVYGLIVFPKVLGNIEVAVVDFFQKLRQGINPVPTILAETFRSLNNCRKKGEGHFIGTSVLKI
ncbi:hypothetical protein Gotur_029085 [Gossypium turneri]